MNAGIIRVFLVFSTIVSFFALVASFFIGYMFFRAPLPDVPSWSPLVGGLLGLAIACIVLGPGLILAGIYENTLATAKALRQLNGDYKGASTGPSAQSSDDALREELPLHAGHYLFIAAVLALLAYVTYALVQRNMPPPEQTQEEQVAPS
jgi:ABC-type branched-subunit amino acid transport system permease subunit